MVALASRCDVRRASQPVFGTAVVGDAEVGEPALGGAVDAVVEEVVDPGDVEVVVDEVVVDEPVAVVVVDVVVAGVVVDDVATTVPAAAILTSCWAVFPPAVATRAQASTPQLKVVAPVSTMRFVAKAVGGIAPAAVVTNGVVVVTSHCEAVAEPPHSLTVTTCPSARPVEGLTLRAALDPVAA
jgi:hypothetical protein